MHGVCSFISCLLFASIAGLPAPSLAAGAGALLEAGDTGLRSDLSWLADRRIVDIGLGTWPMPLQLVRAALAPVNAASLQDVDRDALDRVRAAMARLDEEAVVSLHLNSARQPISDAGLAVRARSEATVQLQTGSEDLSLRLRLGAQSRPIARDASQAVLDGSYVAAHVPGAVISLAALDAWWGPALYASPVLGNAAPPAPRLAVRRDSEAAPQASALAWLGPWSYELSVGRPRHYHPRGANTIGIRLTARPLAGLEVGVSRFLYWGGAGRPNGLGSLGDALLGRSNIDDPRVPDPSNEIAGVDLRWAVPAWGGTWVAYGHFAGEDEANAAPSKWIATLGLQRTHVLADYRVEWTAEAADTRLGHLFGLRSDGSQAAYQHSVFVDGHYHQGLPVGAFIGGGGWLTTLGVAVTPVGGPSAPRLEARVWRAEVSQFGDTPINAAFGRPGRVHGLSIQGAAETRLLRWRLGLAFQQHTGPADGRRRSIGLVGGIDVPLRQH